MPTDNHVQLWHAKFSAAQHEIDVRREFLIQRIERQLHRDHSVELLFALRWELR